MKQRLLILLTALGLLMAAVGTARADNFGPPNILANNQYHWFAYHPTAGPDIVNAFEQTRQNSYEFTDLVTSFHGAGVADSTNWDVYVEKLYAGAGEFVGLADCRVLNANGRCRHSHILINGSHTDRYTHGQLVMTACHETGHTVGLQHRRDASNNLYYGCMTYDISNNNTILRSHNITQINLNY